MNTPDKVWITAIKNPFDPHNSRVQEWIEPVDGLTAHDCIRHFYPLIGDGFQAAVAVNGRMIPDEQIPVHRIGAGDNVVFTAVPQGDGRDILRTVMLIAVMVVAAYVSGPAGAAYFGAQATASLAGAAIAVGGAMLVNAVLPPQTPDMAGIGSDLGSLSPTYSWTAAPNVYQEGSRWPVLYGTRRITPPVLERHISQYGTEADDYEIKQYLHMLLAVADHAVDSITDVRINGSPIENFPGASYQTRLGTLDQALISGDFYWIRSQTSIGSKIPLDGEYTRTTTGDAVTALELGLIIPNGLYFVQEDGSMGWARYRWQTWYRLNGAAEWTYWNTITLQKRTRSAVRAYAIKTDLPPGRYDIKVTAYDYRVASTSTPYYDVEGWKKQEPSGFEVQTVNQDRYSDNGSYVEYVGEIIQEAYTYPGAALLAIKAPATGELSGGPPVVTCLATRSTIDTVDGAKPASNPAWQAYDMHCNREYGERIAESEFIIDDFAQWASHCTANGYVSNLYIDSLMTLTDAVKNAELVGRGRVVERGTKYSCVVDKATDPSQLFGLGNIIENSFNLSYVPLEEQANVVQVTYWDADNDYIRLIAQAVSPAFNPATDEAVIAQVVLYGCTSATQALKYAKYLLNGNSLLVRSVRFDAAADAIACAAGDVIIVAHDAVDWGESGRVVAAAAGTVALDRDVTLLAGTSYKALVRHRTTDTLEEVALAAVLEDTTGPAVALTGTWSVIPDADAVITIGTAEKVRQQYRIVSITRSTELVRRITALEYNAAVYDDTIEAEPYVPITNPDPVQGLAAREIRDIVAGQYRIGVSLTWHGPAWNWDVYYRVAGATAWQYHGATAEAAYIIDNLLANTAYDFAVTIPGKGPSYGQVLSGFIIEGWANISLPVWRVTGLEIKESGNGSVWYGRDLSLAWHVTAEFWPETADGEAGGAGTFSTAEASLVYRVRVNNPGGSLRREVVVKEAAYTYAWEDNYQDGNGTPSATLSVSVWARNSAGMESSIPATIYVSNPAPAPVTGIQALAYMGGVRCYWSANTDPDIRGYQVRYIIDVAGQEPDWDGIGWLDVDGTELVATLTHLQRVNDTDTAYFQVRARDVFGNVSTIEEAEATADDFFIVESALSAALQSKISDSTEMTSAAALLENQWTLKIQENGYATGMGAILHYLWDATAVYLTGEYVSLVSGAVYIALRDNAGAEPTASPLDWELVPYGARSEIIFLVDKFAIINPAGGDGVKRAPFVVGNVGGVATVGINGALVVDGTITGTAIVTNTLTADHIKGGSFGTLTLSSGKIIINAAGGLEINSATGLVVNDGGGVEFHRTESDFSVLSWYYDTTGQARMYTYTTGGLAIDPFVNGAGVLYLGAPGVRFGRAEINLTGTLDIFAGGTNVSGKLLMLNDDIVPRSGKGLLWFNSSVYTARLWQGYLDSYLYWYPEAHATYSLLCGASGNHWLNFQVWANAPGVSSSWSILSDADAKRDVEVVSDPLLGRLLQLQPKSYSYIDKLEKEIGFVAQDVQPLFPDTVRLLPDLEGGKEGGRLALIYDHITVINTKCIAETAAMIDALAGRVEALEAANYQPIKG
jgi:predicted phage tail protein